MSMKRQLKIWYSSQVYKSLIFAKRSNNMVIWLDSFVAIFTIINLTNMLVIYA